MDPDINPLFTVKGLARLLYRMGRTFDGLSTSSPATEEFLRTGNPAIIGSTPRTQGRGRA